jgi:hypothetical protein
MGGNTGGNASGGNAAGTGAVPVGLGGGQVASGQAGGRSRQASGQGSLEEMDKTVLHVVVEVESLWWFGRNKYCARHAFVLIHELPN